MVCLLGLLLPIGVVIGLVVLALPSERREPMIRLMARGCLGLGLMALAILCVGAAIMVASR